MNWLDDATRLAWDLVIIMSGVALHCYLAYFQASKRAVSAVKAWFMSESGQISLVSYLNDALERKDKHGKSMSDKLGELMLDKVLTWAESPEASAVADRLVDKIQVKMRQWLGGKMTGTGNQVKSGMAAAEFDIGGMIKQAIMNRVLGNPQVQQFLGAPPSSPPPAGGG